MMNCRYEEELERERTQRIEKKRKSEIHKLKRETKDVSESRCRKLYRERHLDWTSDSSDSSSSSDSYSSSTTDGGDAVSKYNNKNKDKKKKCELWEKPTGTLKKKKEIRKNSRRSRGISISTCDSDSSSTESSSSEELSPPSLSPPLEPQCVYGKKDCTCYVIKD